MPEILDKPVAGKVALTGASGFVGGRLRAALVAAGADVVSLVRPNSPPAAVGRSVAVDYADVATLRVALERERPNLLIHAAGVTKGVRYEDFRDGNLRPTEALLQALQEVHPSLDRFVLISSGAAYGPSNQGPAKREGDPREPIEHYGRSKLEAEQALEALGDALRWTIIRPVCVYGPGDVDFFPLFAAAHRRINVFFGNRRKRASFVYVDDLVRAIVAAAQHEATLGRGYFVCDGEPRTWQALQASIVDAVGKRTLELDVPSFVVKLAAVAGEALTAADGKPRLLNRQKALMDHQSAWVFDSSAAREDFDYEPRVHVDDGVLRTYRWYQQEGWL